MTKIRDKLKPVSLITGASEGIGKALAHEFAHYLFGSGHIRNTSNLSLLTAFLWYESRGMHSWERSTLDWIDFKEVSTKKNTSYFLDDYITTGDALRIKLSDSEWYLIENHQRLSPNDWAQDKGVYIFHVTNAKKFPPSITNECADGNWNFIIDTKKRKLIKTTPDKKGKNETNFFKRKNGTNYACYEELYGDNSAWGDQYDAYDLTYNNLFSPVSNPGSGNLAKKSFAVEIKEKRGNKYKLNIYFNNIYKNTAPSKPQIFSLENNNLLNPVLKWLPNKEPDLKSYSLYLINSKKIHLGFVGKNTNLFKLKHLRKRKINYVYLIAIDKDGKKSFPSNLISIEWNNKKKTWIYKLLEKNRL